MSERLISSFAMVLISFTLGMVVGVVNVDGLVNHVSVTGTIGQWFAGLATFSAVVFALWQSHENRHKERMKARVLDNNAIEDWSLSVVSEGLIPVTVVDVDLIVGKGSYKSKLEKKKNLQLSFPHKLERGEVLQLISMEKQSLSDFADWLLAPFVSELSSKGIHQGRVGAQLNDAYFDALNSLSKSKLKIAIHFAHESISHVVSSNLLNRLVMDLSERHKADQLEKLRERQVGYDEVGRMLQPDFIPK
ncbi:hypothetical protein OR626_24115 [Pseudomonas sp. S1Bt30]|uniref:Uncharacterized protein n=1 Tax=Pseudomonas quebecensis TaxID=2995174 RepID=A0ABY6QQ81_9PSED|nr:hypothetical protein [Pseudomonas quebecensis]MCX4067302.1 hypothetical protein [Pseudomonas quebecensis]UZW21113.1 hypothetical protein OSC50_12485 [Pseudomonas quebecensis]UZW21469.1 hypothetical protein OSC48_12995 [Pseudomonas quebecensis]UZW26528.1 hypothetical protein OSC49_13000 [Pseudomonas quebecensis]